MSNRKKNKRSTGNPVWDWINTLKLKDLKRAALMKGIDFRYLSEVTIPELQVWVYQHHDVPNNIPRIAEYDKWLEDTLMAEGAIDAPIHEDLKLNPFIKSHKRDANLFGVKKSKEEVAYYKPKKGTMKMEVFSMMEQGKSTKEIIEWMGEHYPMASEGSIKVWCSQARKKLKALKELNDRNNEFIR